MERKSRIHLKQEARPYIAEEQTASQEQLQELVRLTQLFTAGKELQSAGPGVDDGKMEYFYSRVLPIDPNTSMEVSFAVDVDNEWVAGIAYDHTLDGQTFTKNIHIRRVEDRVFAATISWSGMNDENVQYLEKLPIWDEFVEFATRMDSMDFFMMEFFRDCHLGLTEHEAQKEVDALKRIMGTIQGE